MMYDGEWMGSCGDFSRGSSHKKTYKMKDVKSELGLKIVKYIFNELKEFEPYLYHVSSHNSVYVKFRKGDLRSIRIADHKGRTKYKYKWNIDTRLNEPLVLNDRNVVRNFYGVQHLRLLVNDIKAFATVGYNTRLWG